MARFDQGWVKVWRLHREHWLEKDRFTKSVLILLIEWANYQDSPPNSKVILKRGQLATSAYELAKVFRIDRQRIRTSLKLLQEASVINLQSNLHGTIITICNYEKYQATEKELTQELTYDQPTTNLPLTYDQPINKEVKQLRRKEVKNLVPLAADASVAKNFIAHFCEQYKAKYSTNPVIDGRSAGAVKRILKEISLEKAKDLATAYFQMHDQWFVTKSHDLLTFENNLSKIAVFLATGQRISSEQAKRADVAQVNDAAFARMAERIRREEA